MDNFRKYHTDKSLTSNQAIENSIKKSSISADDRLRLIGFFPGLGSRSAYVNAGTHLFPTEYDCVRDIYNQAARVLGYPDQPERALLLPTNIPTENLEKHAFLGVAFLAHNLALQAHFRAVLDREQIPINFIAYTGESLGIIAALVACGALSCQNALKIAKIFEPLTLLYFSKKAHSSAFFKHLKSLIPINNDYKIQHQESYFVFALKSRPDELARATIGISKYYSQEDIEVHKIYSNNQSNFYVRSSLRQEFMIFMKNFPAVEVNLLKGPTEFIAHSTQMREIRNVIAKFIELEGITFLDPHTPIISNHGKGVIHNSLEARDAVFALADQIMESRATAKGIEMLTPDIVIEFGLGQKSIKLLHDNKINAQTIAYTGAPTVTTFIANSIRAIHQIRTALNNLRNTEKTLHGDHYNSIRKYFKEAASCPNSEKLLYTNLLGTLDRDTVRTSPIYSPTYYQYLEILQHTYCHRTHVDIAKGEIVLKARIKKRILKADSSLGRSYTEIKVLHLDGTIRILELENTRNTEMIVFHFKQDFEMSLDDLAHNLCLLLRTQPSAKAIWDAIAYDLHINPDYINRSKNDQDVLPTNLITMGYMAYKYLIFRLIILHRPAIVARNLVYFTATDKMGWLLALAATGSVTITEAINFYVSHIRRNDASNSYQLTLEKFISSVGPSSDYIVHPNGEILQSRKEIGTATKRMFREDSQSTQTTLRLPPHGNSDVIAIGSAISLDSIDTSSNSARIISIESLHDIWNKSSSSKLSEFDDASISSSTGDNKLVLNYAKSRKIASSTIYSYLAPTETLIGFGHGGSESMTMFITRDESHGK